METPRSFMVSEEMDRQRKVCPVEGG
jgi:hypothetical protein